MTLYPCGCSHLKVALGLCDVYAPDGTPRGQGTDAIDLLGQAVDTMNSLVLRAESHRNALIGELEKLGLRCESVFPLHGVQIPERCLLVKGHSVKYQHKSLSGKQWRDG